MALRLRDETSGIDVLDVNNGSATVGIDGLSDAVHLISVSGNVIVKSTNVIYDNCTVTTCANPTTGSATTDGSGNVVVSTPYSQPVIVPASTDLNGLTSTSFTLHGPASTSIPYRYW